MSGEFAYQAKTFDVITQNHSGKTALHLKNGGATHLKDAMHHQHFEQLPFDYSIVISGAGALERLIAKTSKASKISTTTHTAILVPLVGFTET